VVFQSHALMPWMSVLGNVAFAVKSKWPDWSKQKIAEHCTGYLEMVGLGHAIHKKPAELSGGMKQRVGIARAFAIQPKMLLLDEPFGALDALTRGTIQDELLKIVQATAQTVFMITHDVDEAILLSDRILLMSNGPRARIAEIVEVTLPAAERATTCTTTRVSTASAITWSIFWSAARKTRSRLAKSIPRSSAPAKTNRLLPQLQLNFSRRPTMNREEVTDLIVTQKVKKKLTWAKLAEVVGHSKEWSTAALLGQMTLTEAQAKAVGAVLDLPEEAVTQLQVVPYKGSLPTAVPTDPLIYRFYELISIYGTTFKSLIHEEFGDGIMSAIDFNMDLTREPDPKGDRVRIVMSGKFLPYKTY
jgi:cyanase